ncbi:MAG: hypothetical protein FJZ01_00040 [Candidatus Sericytochromatia bacterium]|nr:hypothetical protein [Candidatus Tanganyikabacteria bacterium]
MAIPAPVKDLWTFWRDIEAKTMRAVDVALVAVPGPTRDAWRDALLLGSDHRERLKVVDPDDTRPVRADLAIVLLDLAAAPWRDSFRALDRFPRERIVAVIVGTGNAEPGRQREAIRALGVSETHVLPAGNLADLAGPLAARLFGLFHDLIIPLARHFPVLRSTAAWEEIHATAKQNAIVGVIPVPGGDMPIMTANQIKMLLRMAAMFDMPLNGKRAREIVAVVGGGFGLRTLARQLVKVVPGPGWIVGGTLGYGGTLAMGRAALEYFRRTAPGTGPVTVRAEDWPDKRDNGRGGDA